MMPSATSTEQPLSRLLGPSNDCQLGPAGPTLLTHNRAHADTPAAHMCGCLVVAGIQARKVPTEPTPTTPATRWQDPASPAVLLAGGVVLDASGTTTWACLGAALLLPPVLGLARADLGGAAVLALLLR